MQDAPLAPVRLIPPEQPSFFVDLLFASSGIEQEIVAAADPIEVIEGLAVRVATIAHLIATKVLSRDDDRRPQDRIDLSALLNDASESDLTAAREALRTIQERGYHRGKDLLPDLEKLLPELGGNQPKFGVQGWINIPLLCEQGNVQPSVDALPLRILRNSPRLGRRPVARPRCFPPRPAS